jgi:hypothetical protein
VVEQGAVLNQQKRAAGVAEQVDIELELIHLLY